MTSICWKVPAVWVVAPMLNCHAKPAGRTGIESAPRTSWETFTRTTSPTENGREGVSRIVWLAFRKSIVPLAVPVSLPKTRKLDAVTEAGSRG